MHQKSDQDSHIVNEIISESIEIEIERSPVDLWDEIGFHKPMAGFWYNILYTIIGIVISTVAMGYLMNYFYPYPESWGYKSIAYDLFALMFLVFDIGTGSVMGRFIPEANIKDPQKMLHYIQYFIWYQMITGLIQTTIVSIYAIYYVPKTELGYAVWIMLIVSITQYPGFLGVFRNVLDALQQFHKTQTLTFLTGTLLQRLTELLFVWMGRIYGEAHPEIGPILGIAIGASIGMYVDDFVAMALSAKFFADSMKVCGIKPRDCFRIEFTWIEIKPVLIYAIKTGLPGVINGLLTLVNLMIWIQFVPQYATIKILAAVGGSIPDVMSWFGSPNITALVSESYMNNKKKLTQYYIGQIIRFFALLQGFFVPLILTIFLVMPTAFKELGMVNYIPATLFIIPRLINTLINKYAAIPGQVMYGANKPNVNIIGDLVKSTLNTGTLALYLIVFKLYDDLTTIAWIMECGFAPMNFIFMIIYYFYIHKKLVEIKVPFGQILWGFFGSSCIACILNLIIKFFLFDPLYETHGFYIASIPSLFLMTLVLFIVFFPLTGILGGWDDDNLAEFKKVAKMSGPSKFIVVPIYNILEKVSSKSKLHNRFQMPVAEVKREAQELLALKLENRDKYKKLN